MKERGLKSRNVDGYLDTLAVDLPSREDLPLQWSLDSTAVYFKDSTEVP